MKNTQVMIVNNRLKIGVLARNSNIPNWSYQMLKQLVVEHEIEIVTFVTFPNISKNKSLIFRLYEKYEKKVFPLTPDSLKLMPSSTLLNYKAHNISITIENLETSIQQLKAYDLDLIIKTDCQIPNSKLEQVTKYGVWTIYIGNIVKAQTQFPCAMEVLTNKDTIDINLICEKTTEKAVILSSAKVSVDKMSIRRTSNNVFWLSSRLILRELKTLMKMGAENHYNYINKNSVSCIQSFKTNPIFLSDQEIIFSISKKYFKKIKNILIELFYINQWVISYSFNTEKIPLQELNISNLIPLLPPKDRFWADPFVYKRNNSYYIFFEELIYNNVKGHLSVMKINEDGTHTKPEVILKKPYHLSYPFIFEDDDILYMIPETSENKTIELYQSTEFPTKWKLVKTLMKDIDAVDTTIIKKNNIYWLFTNISEQKGYSKNNELFLFFSSTLTSDNWTSHPKNPIVSDVTKSRPAGKIYESKNKIFRPSQNCGKAYGHSMFINEVIELSKIEYIEKVYTTLEPGWNKNVLCTHSINKESDLTVIDILYKRRKF